MEFVVPVNTKTSYKTTRAMDKIWQEIHCTTSGGGCGGYILVGLNKHLNRIVTIICPKCQHEHRRRVKNGHVEERDRWKGEPEEELCPTMAAWTKKPRTVKMQEPKNFQAERDGAVIDGWEAFQDQQMRTLWQEYHGGQE